MKIRTRLTFLFSGITAAILLLLVTAIYISYAREREDDYYKNLRQQAITKANLLFDAGIDPHVLQLIYRNSSSTLSQEEVAIYDTDLHLLYHDAVDIDKVKETPGMLEKIKQQKEIVFKQDQLQVVGFTYSHQNKTYLITAVAEDEYGLARLRNLGYILAFSYLIAVLCIIIVARFFAKKALKPVSDMVDRVEEITATNLDLRLPEGNGTDEMAELAITFNQMLDRLEQSFDAQKQFVSNISHELRTPLTAMMAELEISASRERTTAEYLQSMHHAISDARQLVKLSNSLLDLAKASYDPAEINFKPMRLDELLMEARDEVLKAFPFYRINVNFEEPQEEEDYLSVEGNAYLLKVAFVNLMENGCKFSASHEMGVVVTWFKEYTILRFIDDGVGISKQDLPNIFTPFYRGGNGQYADGNGIGLSLAARIVKLHKGTISVVSKVGQGTTFTVELTHV